MKNKKCYIIILCLIFDFCSTIYAQSNEDMLIRYWYYRSRLKNHFLNVGTAPGESLPMSYLFGASSYEVYDPLGTIPNNKILDNNGFDLNTGELWGQDISMGDLDIGWYMAVLATEYRLLKNNNKQQELLQQQIEQLEEENEKLKKK